MGDISTEPSMEEILSSIKRIIAEEGDTAPARARRPAAKATTTAPAADPVADDEGDEVLELSEPAPEVPEPAARAAPMPIGAPDTPHQPRQQPQQQQRPDPILSDQAAEATRGPLEALSRMVVTPDVPGSDTLEGMVREMLKPMLRDWLDANLPRIVENMVSREIERITGRR